MSNITIESKRRMTLVTDNATALHRLKGHKIVDVTLDRIPEKDGSESSGYPKLLLDDGTCITFNVVDYGSGTYGVDMLVSTKGKA